MPNVCHGGVGNSSLAPPQNAPDWLFWCLQALSVTGGVDPEIYFIQTEFKKREISYGMEKE